MQKYDYDYLIIGGGPAGVAAAKALAKTSKKVAIVEQNQWGGSYAASRDVPYAASLYFSHLYAKAMYGARFGISSTALKYNYPTAAHWREKASARAVMQVKRELEEAKVTMIRGRAHFVGKHEVSVKRGARSLASGVVGASGVNGGTSANIKGDAAGKNVISAKKILIATGVTPKNPGISGVETVNYYTPETILKAKRLPKTVLVVGAGASGCEVAQYLAELGSKVVIAEIAGRILPREDKEVGEVLTEYLTKRFGMKILTGARVIAAEPGGATASRIVTGVTSGAVDGTASGMADGSTSGIRRVGETRVIFLKDGKEKMVKTEAIVLATGSQPALDLGLENAGVKFTAAGIKVEKTLQTSEKHIFAAGDVVSGDISTEKAEYQGGIAAMNMAGRATNYVNYNGFIRVTDTDPQIAVVGLTEDDLAKRGRKYNSVVIPLSKVAAANVQDFRMGFIKMLASHDGKILGATLMAPGAAEAIQEVAVMIRHNFSVIEIASTPHVVMGWSELVRQAARELARKK